MRGITKLISGAVIAVGAFFAFNAYDSTINAADCSANSVIKCGTYSIDKLRQMYNSDSTPGTQNIFSHFGLNSNVINSAAYKDGYVTKSGDIVVGGETVATGAMTAGRQYIAGSTKRVVNGTTFYERAPSVSFRSSQLSAFVFFDAEGKFIGAVIKDCGNPVSGANKVVPPAPPVPKEPVFTCDSLTARKIDRTRYEFTPASSSQNGPVFIQYNTDFGDGQTGIAHGPVEHNYAKEGTYTVKFTALFRYNFGGGVERTIRADSPNCVVQVTVAPEEQPKTPSVKIEKTVNTKKHDTVEVNKPFTYELKVTNNGQVDLKNVVVSDPAPEGVKFQSADKGTITNNKWTYTIPELKIGASASFKITAIATKEMPQPNKNTACVNAPEVPGEQDDCDDATIDTKVKACNTETGVIEQVVPGKENTAPHTTDMSKCSDVEVCDTKTGNIITVPKKDENKDGYEAVDSPKCKVKVCDTTTGKIIDVTKEEQKNNPNYVDKDSDKCKVPVCDTKTGDIVEVPKGEENNPGYVDKDSDKCKDTPPPVTPPTPVTPTPEAPTPVEMPKTGMADVFSGVLGLGAMTTAGYYYLVSRRNG